MAIEYNFTLDMDRSKRDNNIAYARTGDVDSITINADLVLNGAAYTPTGTNAFFECVTPNGHSIRAAAEKTGSSVSVEVPSAAFQAAGVINVAYFRFESGETDNPTYVESTEPFAIVVREGIGDNIDAGDYIEEWRGLADQLEAAVVEVEKKAEQAETAINEQKTEVDQLKAQAQKAIAGNVTEVEETAQSAIAAINKEKADVADAAEGVSAAGEQAINTFKTNSQQAISQFNTDGTAAINQFNTNAGSKLDEVDGMITEAQGDVDAAIKQLEDKTQDAIDAAQDALDGTTATNLQNAINRTLKLDVADMTSISDNSSLSSFTNVGSYCCKTASTAATIGDCPVDDSPFNMYVFSSATSGQVMQLVVPIDLNSKPTAEWHVRFGTSSAMDPWSVIGGGADIAAGIGIDVTGDAKKTVALDTTAFYQHHEAASIIQGSAEVTGGGRFKELVVYGNTRQNLWVNPSGTDNGLTVTANEDGSITLSGTPTSSNQVNISTYVLRPGSTYTVSKDVETTGVYFRIQSYDSGGSFLRNEVSAAGWGNVKTFTLHDDAAYVQFGISAAVGHAVSGTYRVMLREATAEEIAAAQQVPSTLQEGGTADLPQDHPVFLPTDPSVYATADDFDWCPPGLNGVDELSIVTAGKNLLPPVSEWSASGNYVRYIENPFPIGTQLVGRYGGNPSGLSGNVRMEFREDYRTGSTEGMYSSPITSWATTSTAGLGVTVTARDRYICLIAAENAAAYFNQMQVQLELGSTATAYEPPAVTSTPVDLDGYALNSLPDGTRDELRIDGTGAVTLVQRVGVATAPTEASGWTWDSTGSRGRFTLPATSRNKGTWNQSTELLCDKLPPATSVNDASHAVTVNDAAYAKNPAITSAATAATVAGGATYLYPLAEPQEVDLPGIAMPDLASPNYTIFTSSNVPAEIEAEVVKVDYLPPSDVYTKEEVDKKIEDAGGMPDIVPVSQGGTGVTTAAAERNRLGLGNTTGALPVANGGTGGTSAKAAQNSLLNDMNVSSDALTDSSMLVGYNASPSASNGAVHKRSVSTVWDYIVGKIRSTFGFSSGNVLPVSHGGTGATAPGVDMLSNLGITFGTADPPSTGTPGSIYIQYFE